MTRDELTAKAPSGSAGLFNHGDGTVAFYPAGTSGFNGALFRLPYEVKKRPEEMRWLAYKYGDEWIWYESKNTDASRVLEALGYAWSEELEKWEAPAVEVES
jgi:hypothetical protein